MDGLRAENELYGKARIVMKLYALKHTPSQGWYGDCGEKHPMTTRYYLYNQEIAEKRRLTMNYPEEWEVAVSPRQSRWID